MGGWDLLGEVPLKLWIESAHQSLTKAGVKVCSDAVRILQTEKQFSAVLVSRPQGDGEGKGDGKNLGTTEAGAKKRCPICLKKFREEKGKPEGCIHHFCLSCLSKWMKVE